MSSFENNMVSAFDHDACHHGPAPTSQQKEDIKQSGVVSGGFMADENSLLYGDFVTSITASQSEDFLPSFRPKDEGPPIMRTGL
jgi:hypothetical protein